MPICPYCIHIWIDFNEGMYIPTVLLKLYYVYYSYMCNPHVLTFKFQIKLTETSSSEQWQRSCMYVCMYVCMCIYYIYMNDWALMVVLVISGAKTLLLINHFSVWIILHYQVFCPIP